MSKKKRIKELERRIASLEAEITALRGQRTTWIQFPPTIPASPTYPGTWPQITCTNPNASDISDRIVRAALLSGRN